MDIFISALLFCFLILAIILAARSQFKLLENESIIFQIPIKLYTYPFGIKINKSLYNGILIATNLRIYVNTNIKWSFGFGRSSYHLERGIFYNKNYQKKIWNKLIFDEYKYDKNKSRLEIKTNQTLSRYILEFDAENIKNAEKLLKILKENVRKNYS
jgi:hypothetical protein